MLPLDYFDNIVKNASHPLSPIYQDQSIGRNLYTFTTSKSNSNSNNDSTQQELLLCHVPIFGNYSSITEATVPLGAMLAIHHWNNGNDVIVKEIKDINETCNLRFTSEMFHTNTSPRKAIQDLMNVMSRSIDVTDIIDHSSKSSSSAEQQRQLQPCAILGPKFSSVSVQFATITGIYDLLQISPSASSLELENNNEYPTFARTHPSDGGSGKIMIDYLFRDLNVTKFVVVHTGDSYGDEYNKVINDYASKKNLTCVSKRLNVNDVSEKSVKELLKDISTQQEVNYFVGIFYSIHYETIMTVAGDLGLAGNGKLWIFSGSLSHYLYYGSKTYPRNSILANATFGNAILSDGIGNSVGSGMIPEYDAFVQEWEKLVQENTTIQYFNSKQPSLSLGGDDDQFLKQVAYFTIYAYEAIIGMGLSACEAIAKSKEQQQLLSSSSNTTTITTIGFSGTQHHDEFLNIQFKSASGNVNITPGTISRDSNSMYYTLSNIVEKRENDDHHEHNDKSEYITLQGVDYRHLNSFNEPISDFIYSDGTNKPPVVNVIEDMNLHPKSTRIFAWTFCAMLVIMTIGFMIYTIIKRKHRIIRMAQPPFLYMICTGSLLLATSIIPLLMDEGIGMDKISLSRACTSTMWFACIGFVVTFSALFSKLWRLNKVCESK